MPSTRLASHPKSFDTPVLPERDGAHIVPVRVQASQAGFQKYISISQSERQFYVLCAQGPTLDCGTA
jgi:hypothetical protein